MQLALGLGAIVVGGVVVYALVNKGAKTVTQAVGDTVKAGANALNPANPNNVFATAANAVTPSGSVGSAVYDVMNTVRGWFGAGDVRADSPVNAGVGRVSPNAATLVAQFGGDKLTREDVRWQQEQLYGPSVGTADIDDAEMGQWMRANNPAAAAADRLLFAVKP